MEPNGGTSISAGRDPSGRPDLSAWLLDQGIESMALNLNLGRPLGSASQQIETCLY